MMGENGNVSTNSCTHRGFSRLATNSLRSLKPLRLVRPVRFMGLNRVKRGQNGFVILSRAAPESDEEQRRSSLCLGRSPQRERALACSLLSNRTNVS